MLLLPEEPAGTIPTRTAGAAEFTATLTWRSPQEMPPGPLLIAPPGSEAGTVRCSVTENDEDGFARRIRARIQALDEGDLTAALDYALRSVNEAAALTQALLEARCGRLAPLRTFPVFVRELLAKDLRGAGFEVRFAPVWTPHPAGVDVAVGTRGAGRKMQAFFEGRPSWKVES